MKKPVVGAVLIAALIMILGAGASAADRAKDVSDGSRFSERARKSDWEKGKEELTRGLKVGEDRDFYRKELDKLGYQIASVNYDKADYMEYEVVKGNQTWEIGVDVDKTSHKGTKVDVSTNMWKADATDQALKGHKVASNDRGLFKPANKRFSDRDRKGSWEKGKQELERALKTGEDKAAYRRDLEKLGYHVTSVNSDKPDYLEYEVVKSDRTYEIQFDLDKNTHKAIKIDVTANVWRADETEQALKSRQAKR